MFRGQRLTIAIAALALVFAGAAGALVLADRDGSPASRQAQAQGIGEDRGIAVTGEGQVTVVPDTANVVLGVEVEGDDVGALREDANSRMNAVIDVLQEHGIAEEDIRTVSYDLSVQRDDRPPEPRDEPAQEPVEEETTDEADVEDEASVEDPGEHGVESYRLLQLVQVTVRDIDATGDIIDVALDSGANRVANVHFEVDDRSAAIEQARERAVDEALGKAQHLADLTGVGLGAPIHIDERSPSVPPVRMDRPAMDVEVAEDMAAPIEPGESVITVNVNIVYSIE